MQNQLSRAAPTVPTRTRNLDLVSSCNSLLWKARRTESKESIRGMKCVLQFSLIVLIILAFETTTFSSDFHKRLEWNGVTLGLTWVKTKPCIFFQAPVWRSYLTLSWLWRHYCLIGVLLISLLVMVMGSTTSHHQSSSPNLSQPAVVGASMPDGFLKCKFVVGEMIHSVLICCFSPPMEDTSHWISWFTHGTIPRINCMHGWAKEQPGTLHHYST